MLPQQFKKKFYSDNFMPDPLAMVVQNSIYDSSRNKHAYEWEKTQGMSQRHAFVWIYFLNPWIQDQPLPLLEKVMLELAMTAWSNKETDQLFDVAKQSKKM